MEFKVRDKRNKGWFYTDNECINGHAKIIGIGGIAIYNSLCRHSDNEQKCFPSYNLLAEEFNVSLNTIKKYIKILKECNLIHIEQNKKADGTFENNIYWLIDKSEWITPQTKKHTTAKTDYRRPKFDTTVDQNLTTTVDQNLPHKDTNMIKDTNIKNTNIYTIFEYWNSKISLINHKTFTDKAKTKVTIALKTYSQELIQQAIDNYAEVLVSPGKFYWTHRWTLADFCQRGIDKFLNEAKPLENFIIKQAIKPEKIVGLAKPQPGKYAHLSKGGLL